MHIDEFISHVRAEPVRTVRLAVRKVPAALADARARGGIALTEYMSVAAPGGERDVEYRHVLGGPVESEILAEWEDRHSLTLPSDLKEMLKRFNGVHLWADTLSQRSYVGLAPIEEWQSARCAFFGPDSDPALLDDRYIAISYHDDGSSYLVLDPSTGRYYLMDAAGPDESAPLGNSVEDVLEWLWRVRMTPSNK